MPVVGPVDVGPNPLDGLTIGSGSVFEPGPGTASPVNGFIGEIIVYNARLLAPDVDTIEAYLKTRWGTP